ANDRSPADQKCRRVGEMNHKRLAVTRDQRVHAGGFQSAAFLRNIATKKILGNTEADETDGCFQQRGFNLLAFAGALARRDGGENSVGAVESGGVVPKRGDRALGLVEGGKDAQKAAQRLTERIVTGFFSVRPVLSEGGNRAVNNLRIEFPDVFVTDTQAINHARS